MKCGQQGALYLLAILSKAMHDNLSRYCQSVCTVSALIPLSLLFLSCPFLGKLAGLGQSSGQSVDLLGWRAPLSGAIKVLGLFK